MPTREEIDAVAHVLYDQDTYRIDLPPTIPLLATGKVAVIKRYRERAQQLLKAAERART